MKNVATRSLDTSSLLSNLLIVCAVLMAVAPMILGDRLVLIVSAVFTQGALLIQTLSTFLQKLFS